jgi:outer membrane lipoprotein-sorting protein
MKLLLALLLAADLQDDALVAAQAAPGGDALRKLAERFRDAKTLSAKVVQSRRTSLLREAIMSSGMLYYRRDPARLVFRLSEPRTTEIHLDRSAYQVFRPEAKRLERMEFEEGTAAARLLMLFDPKPEEIEKAFALSSAPAAEGETETLLEPKDDRARRRLRRLSLTLATKDGALRRITVTDADGDETRFDLSALELNPDLPPKTFGLELPEGTRVLRHAVKEEK